MLGLIQFPKYMMINNSLDDNIILKKITDTTTGLQ